MPQHKIFLFGVGNTISKNSIYNYFSSKFLSLVSVQMKKRNKKTHKISGYCFLIFSNSQEYESILKQQYFTVEGRVLTAKPYLKGDKLKAYKQDVTNRRLFVCRIPLHMADLQLEQLLSQLGRVEQAYIVRDPQNPEISKGYGFVNFMTKSEADYALRVGTIKIHGSEAIKILKKREKSKGNLLEEYLGQVPRNSSHNVSQISKFQEGEIKSLPKNIRKLTKPHLNKRRQFIQQEQMIQSDVHNIQEHQNNCIRNNYDHQKKQKRRRKELRRMSTMESKEEIKEQILHLYSLIKRNKNNENNENNRNINNNLQVSQMNEVAQEQRHQRYYDSDGAQFPYRPSSSNEHQPHVQEQNIINHEMVSNNPNHQLIHQHYSSERNQHQRSNLNQRNCLHNSNLRHNFGNEQHQNNQLMKVKKNHQRCFFTFNEFLKSISYNHSQRNIKLNPIQQQMF